ncbi:hypothetical protein WN944_002813 [Citrus x changshan-huyou]|uniref:Uncharacterized protein n=1 Tax=Citrus x changshan-huyou TaxID=2935761 RepID=A0AAP0MJ21_9ROSI
MSGLDLEQKSSRTSALNCNKSFKVVHTTGSVELLKKKKELVEQNGNESSPIDFHVRNDGSWPSDSAKELHEVLSMVMLLEALKLKMYMNPLQADHATKRNDSTGKLNANDDGGANYGDVGDTNSYDNGGANLEDDGDANLDGDGYADSEEDADTNSNDFDYI